jgi:vacuolar-type H+-ATPase subunit H
MSDAPAPDAPPPGETSDGAPSYRAPQAESLLRQAIELVEEARPMPLSASSMINKEEVLAVLTAAVQSLPDELRSARWLLKERDDFLARVQTEGDEIIARARTRAEQMVQRTELVKSAEDRARKVVAEAEERAKNLRLETEDWCDQKLGGMEVVLERTMRTVASGRARLQGAVEDRAETDEPEPLLPDESVFDQDV